MRQQWLQQTGASDLVLVFGGWALGAAPFSGMQSEADVLLVDGYADLGTPVTGLADYDRVVLVAFSFGVPSAGHWLGDTGFLPDRKIAIAGTLKPADSDFGIAPEVIRATADQLSARSFAKFCRRAGLEGPAPEIDVAAARAELFAVIDRGPSVDPEFDRIWIPTKDRIIPTGAQQAAWASQASVVKSVAGPHVPFRPGQSWEAWIA